MSHPQQGARNTRGQPAASNGLPAQRAIVPRPVARPRRPVRLQGGVGLRACSPSPKASQRQACSHGVALCGNCGFPRPNEGRHPRVRHSTASTSPVKHEATTFCPSPSGPDRISRAAAMAPPLLVACYRALRRRHRDALHSAPAGRLPKARASPPRYLPALDST